MLALLSAIGLVLSLAQPASATTTFDYESGTGFVGKGDVQFAFGWSNQQLQKNSSATDFQYIERLTYKFDCEYWFENRQFAESRYRVVTENFNLNDLIGYDARERKQITGFVLKGFKTATAASTIPVEGDTCDAAGTVGSIASVTEESSDRKLHAVYGGSAVIIWRNDSSVLP